MAVRKGVDLGKADFPGKVQRFSVVLRRFTGKADHHVGGEGRTGEGLPDGGGDRAVLGGVVVAVHAGQGGVAAALQRKMELGAELFSAALRQPVDLLRGQQIRLDGTEPHPFDAGDGGRCQNGVGKVQAPFPPVVGKVDAGQDNLPVAVLRQRLQLRGKLRHRFAAHRAAGGGDDAVAAPVIAAVLDFEKGAGAHPEIGGGAGFEGFAALVRGDADNALPVNGKGLDQLRQGSAVPGAGDDIRLGDGGGFLREGLRIAAGQHDNGAGVFPAKAPYRLTGLAVAFGGDGAAAHHIDVAARRMAGHDIKAGGGKPRRQHLGFVLIHLAAKGIKGNAHRRSSGEYH